MPSQVQTRPTTSPSRAPSRPQRRSAWRTALAPAHLALAAILALSAVLNTVRLGQNGWANTFYSAGVKSMLGSLHNFLFASFDQGGLVTIDKPPLGIWVQVLSAKLFGFSPLSLLLPEAIVGTLTVLALYAILARRVGVLAALAAALALAVFPVFVAVSRDNGVDPLLVLLMLLACGAALRAIERGRVRWLLLAGALVGLAFNTKTLAAYLVVPSIALGYLVCALGGWRRRLLALGAFAAVTGAVSFAWIAMVELTPASQRPYVGSSTDNTEIGLTLEYNGLGRVEGEVGGPGKIPLHGGAIVHSPRHRGGAAARARHAAKPPAQPSKFLPDGRYRYPIAFGGAVGPLRLFGSELNGQAAWTLPLAVIGALALALQLLWPPRRRRAPDRRAAGAGEPAERDHRARRAGLRRDPRLAVLLVLGGWFAIELVVLSYSKGIVHPYYLSALAPGAAAMIGAGLAAFASFARPVEGRGPARRDRPDRHLASGAGSARHTHPGARPDAGPTANARLALSLALALAVAATVATQIAIIEQERYLQWFVPFLVAGAALLTLAAALLPRLALPALALLLAVLLVAPTAYATTTWLAPVEGTFPAAGPHEAVGFGRYGVEGKSLSEDRKLIAYVAAHRGARARMPWSVLTDSAPTAAPFILLGSPAGALGGYGGTDPVLDGRGLARLIARGQARYVILGGEYASRGGNAATAAVLRDCPQVPHTAWHGPVPGPSVLVLFDCAGRERALQAHPRG
jgi:4-amino-4-deoxy-L-arabinose transferase-like glycosyltransferase